MVKLVNGIEVPLSESEIKEREQAAIDHEAERAKVQAEETKKSRAKDNLSKIDAIKDLGEVKQLLKDIVLLVGGLNG